MSPHFRRTTRTTRTTAVRTMAVVAVVAAGMVLTGCGRQEADPVAEPGAPLASETAPPAAELLSAPPSPYVGPYDADFSDQIGTYPETGQTSAYEGMEVTLTGEVDEIINPIAVTITDPADSTVAPLLVVRENAEENLAPGDLLEVTGTLHAAYNVPTVEEDLGQAPDEEVLAHYDGEPFVWATSVNNPTPSAMAG